VLGTAKTVTRGTTFDGVSVTSRDASNRVVGGMGRDPVMEVLHYGYGNVLLRLDDHVLELFRRINVDSLRVPLLWACATLSPHKRDLIRVAIGAASDPATPFYSPNSLSSGNWIFNLPILEEPRLRLFLDEAASRAGR
jgi:hypothetical protein